jgi:hypothetical protein
MDFISMALAAIPGDKFVVSTDQKLARAQIFATLAVAQEQARANGGEVADTAS